jgi:hypothetical protein
VNPYKFQPYMATFRRIYSTVKRNYDFEFTYIFEGDLMKRVGPYDYLSIKKLEAVCVSFLFNLL